MVETPERDSARFLSRDGRALAGAGALTVVVVAVSWYRDWTFRSTTYDLGVFMQALWKMAHGHTPEVTTIGWNAFADHLSPVLLLFVPLFRLAATPVWLFAAQGLAAGAGLLALGPLLDATGVRAGAPRQALTFAYIASPLLWNATVYDFHPTTLAIPFLFVGITAALRDQLRVVVAMVVCLVLLRDDLGAAAAALALVGVVALPRRRRLLRGALALVGVGWVAGGSVLGKAMGADRNWHFHYGYLGRNPVRAALHPLRFLHMARFDDHLLFLAWLVPLAFLPLLRPVRFAVVLVLALPLLASAGLQFHSPHFHYGAPLLPFLLLAAAGAVSRVPARVAGWPVAAAVVAGTAVAFALYGPPSTHALTRPVASRADVHRALALVHPGDGVTAGSTLGAHLAGRKLLLPFPSPFTMGRRDFPLAADVRHVSAERAARIDVVIVDAHELAHTRRAYGHFLVSPYLAGFRMHVIGDVIVWRREPGR